MNARRCALVALIFVLVSGGTAWGQAQPPQGKATPDRGLTFGGPGVSPPRAAADRTPGQSPNPCEGNNYLTNAFLNNTSMGGPMVGISWAPSITAPIVINRIEVFTGETTGPISLAVWSDAVVGSQHQPGVNLANTPAVPIVPTNSWQGGDLTHPVVINPATPYWIVFDPAGGEQAPVEQVAAGQPYWGSTAGTVTGGASWFGPFSSPDHGWKFRVFCLTEDHFKCYSVTGPRVNVRASLTDQFESATALVKEPKLLCNPVDKNGEGIPNPSAHLVCYEIEEPRFQPRDVSVNNQFGQAPLKVKAPELLCVPSTKKETTACGPTGIRMCGGSCPRPGQVCRVSPVDAGCECR
jgi:hypothetical protein